VVHSTLYRSLKNSFPEALIIECVAAEDCTVRVMEAILINSSSHQRDRPVRRRRQLMWRGGCDDARQFNYLVVAISYVRICHGRSLSCHFMFAQLAAFLVS